MKTYRQEHEPYDNKTKIFIVLISVALVILLLMTAKLCGAQTNPKQPDKVICNWVPSMDTVKISYVVYYDPKNAIHLTTAQGDYIVQFSERFFCPDFTKPIAERNKRIYFNGNEIDPIFIKTK